MEHLRGRSAEVERTLRLCRKIAKGEDPEDVGFARELVTSYGRVARRVRDDRDMGLSRYPYEAASGASPYTGGYFAHPEWPVRRGLSRHASLRALAEYEANYVTATGYWLNFSEAALALRDEEIARDCEIGNQEAGRLDMWMAMGLRYGLRVVGLRTEFFRMSAKDPVHARMLMPVLEGQDTMAATDGLDDTMAKMDTHMATQLMKAAASLSADNSVRRAGEGGAQQ
jgi:hypothetical protein